MSAYVIGHLRDITMTSGFIKYIKRVDGTVKAYGGRLLARGGDPLTLEGTWPGTVTVIEFPDSERALAWYHSEEYRGIKSLRQQDSVSDTIVIQGLTPSREPHAAPG